MEYICSMNKKKTSSDVAVCIYRSRCYRKYREKVIEKIINQF